MKHQTVAISGKDLLNRVFLDSDAGWRDVIGWNCDELDQLESLSDMTAAQEARRDQLDSECRKEVESFWFVASWPNHVVTPRYNSDGTYASFNNEERARSESDRVYGE